MFLFRKIFSKINPICGASVIVEWLEDIQDVPNLIGEDPLAKAESRRILNWFSKKFYKEVEEFIVYEKIIKGFIGKGQPNSNTLRVGRKNLKIHFSLQIAMLLLMQIIKIFSISIK